MLTKNKIHKGDALKLIKEIDSESIDLIIADPPYGIEKDFGVKEKWGLNKHNEWLSWMKEWLTEGKRVLKPGGSYFVYGIHHNIGYVQTFLYELGLIYGRQFIWHYKNNWSGYTKVPPGNYEPLLWFYKGKEFTYHPIREPYESSERLKYKITKNGKVWKPNPNGKLTGDVWYIPVLAGKRFEYERVNHPTQKPLAICDRIINHFSNPGDLILVPFAGSGSECVSAKLNKRYFIGFELNQQYVNLARGRISKTRSVARSQVRN
jgi:site-specific DNA-methyltransferase (adenine-specific)